MKRIFVPLLAAIMLNASASAQDKSTEGMQFEHLPTWKDVIAKAKKENKLVFLDCYTTWCGPCKMMSSQVFSQKNVGEFYNANYVNAKVQLDETDGDDEYTKNWYSQGKEIADRYDVKAYPTYLIFNGDGEVVHRFVGSMSPEEFIKKGKEILNPENQYYTQAKKYENGDKSPALLAKLFNFAKDSYDRQNKAKYLNEFLALQKDLFTKDVLELLYESTETTKDKGFEIASNNGDKADKVLGTPGRSARLVKDILISESMTQLMGRSGKEPDFAAFEKKVTEEHPQQANFLVSYFKSYYNMIKEMRGKNWNQFVVHADNLFKVDPQADTRLMNGLAKTALDNTTDKAMLAKAASWAKLAMDKEKDQEDYAATYANLLYKMGNKEEAVLEIKKLIPQNDSYKEILEKMKSGKPTWNE